jgi:catechol 2,3-dioxygenase-like lactoylglutathione lyase family enzyme
MANKIEHIAIITLDPDKLAKFYIEVFGMKFLHRRELGTRPPTGAVFVTDGNINLALLPNRGEGKPSGINHIGFHIEDAEEIETKLADWQVAMPAPRPEDRLYAETRCSDPDGNNIDLSVHGYQLQQTAEDREKLVPAKA